MMTYTIGEQIEQGGTQQKIVAIDEENQRVCLRDLEHAPETEGGTWWQWVEPAGEAGRLEPVPAEPPAA